MRAEPRYNVFVSAVSSEFETARYEVASRLQVRNLHVAIQRSFEHGTGMTLGKLHDYIRDCDAVVAIIGERSGAFPGDNAVAPYAPMLTPFGLERASYT